MIKNNKEVKILFSIVVILFVLILLSFFTHSLGKPKTKTEAIKVLPLASGEQVYKIMTDKPRDPQITEVTFDPLDVKLGQTQTITVKVKDTKNGEIVQNNYTTAFVTTDHSSTTVPLKFIRAESQPELTTIWQGSFVPKESNDIIYTVKIVTKNIFGLDSVDMSLR